MDKNGSSAPHHKLLIYAAENCADSFIEDLRNQTSLNNSDILSFYRVAYANRILLYSCYNWFNSDMPLLGKARVGNIRIIRFLESLVKIPSDYREKFCKDIERDAWWEEEDSYEYWLDGSHEELIKKGYREIDCLLFEAGLKLKFERVIELLNQGADPFVPISGNYTPEDALKNHANLLEAPSLYELCYDDLVETSEIRCCWEDGTERSKANWEESIVSDICRKAGFKLLIDLFPGCSKYYTNE